MVELRVCPAIVISPPVLPMAAPNVPLRIQLQASGGTPPYGFRVPPGEQPFSGGILTSDGAIVGTPTGQQTANFTVIATDANLCEGARNYMLAIGCPIIAIEPRYLPVGDVGAPYEVMLTAVGGTGPYSYSASELPPGLDMTNGGRITGTPRAQGLTPVTVAVFDANGCTSQATLALQVLVLDAPGCDCTTSSPPSALIVIAGFGLAVRRRRRASPTA
jgi:MYXO-CTERM domain-containing protein